jgi:hypothetical protein
MEKLVYVRWRRDADSPTTFRAAMLAAARALAARGAARVAVSLADEDVAHAAPARMARAPRRPSTETCSA